MVIKTLPEQKSFGERSFIGCIVIPNTQKVKHFREKFCTAVDKEKTPSISLTGFCTCGIYYVKILLYKSLPILD